MYNFELNKDFFACLVISTMSAKNVEQYDVYIYFNYLEHECREIDQEIGSCEDRDDILCDEIAF